MQRSLFRRFADGMVSEELHTRMRRVPVDLGELGVDPFGLDPKVAQYAAAPIEFLYRNYFRVETKGIGNVPGGRVLLIANHSGQLPFDGAMIGAAMILEHEPPRIVRSMVEKWVPRLPYISTFFARVGQIVGTPDNCRRLLERDEAILVFPEGARGISKTFDKRYQLERFGTGFMRLALESQTPIVPIAVIGAEEQAPSFYNIEFLAKAMGMPAFPVTPFFPLMGPAGLLPMPTKYHLHFGEPLMFSGHGDEEDEVVLEHVAVVKAALEALIARGLSERKGIFV